MNQTISLIVGAILIIGVGGFVYWQKHEAAEEQMALQAAQEAQAQMNGTSASSESSNQISGVMEDGTELEDDDSNSDDDSNASVGAGGSTVTSGSAGSSASYSSADVAKHNTRTSCWSSVNGSVYDLTSWIPKHPGGEQAILSMCGIDGSAKFNGQHGGAALQARILAGFKVGVLK